MICSDRKCYGCAGIKSVGKIGSIALHCVCIMSSKLDASLPTRKRKKTDVQSDYVNEDDFEVTFVPDFDEESDTMSTTSPSSPKQRLKWDDDHDFEFLDIVLLHQPYRTSSKMYKISKNISTIFTSPTNLLC